MKTEMMEALLDQELLKVTGGATDSIEGGTCTCVSNAGQGTTADGKCECDNGAYMRITKDTNVLLPKNLLIITEDKRASDIKFCDKFCPTTTFEQKRPLIPFNVNFMVTTQCTTNCGYCYANRKLSNQLSLPEMKNIMQDCHDQGVVNLTLTGGDIFAMNGWRELLETIGKLNYSTFISTKTPISYIY